MNLAVKWTVTLISILLVSACASVPSKKTADDCLVVIKVRTSNPDNLRLVRQYSFALEPAYPDVTVPVGGQDILFVIREPAVKLVRLTSRIVDGSFSGPASSQPLNIILPYNPGHVVVADFVVLRRLEKTGTGSFRDHFDFAQATDDDKAAAMNALRDDPNLALWDQE